MRPLLSIEDLSVAFRQAGRDRKVVDQLSFQIREGECISLVGESGSGKSVSALSVLRLLPVQGRVTSGRIVFDGQDLLDFPEREMERIRSRRIGMIFQDPMTALNPVMTIGDQLKEALPHDLPRRAQAALSLDLLAQVELQDPEGVSRSYPHELSGGMRQRVLIAMALGRDPDLLIADEPTTALDVTLQAQMVKLLGRLRKERNMALWLITHDFGIAHALSDRVAVMRQGQMIECRGLEFFDGPETAYGRSLLASMPRLSSWRERSRKGPAESERPPLLEVRGLGVRYGKRASLGFRGSASKQAVRSMDLVLHQGETLAVVGASGCGKTSLARAILGLIPMAGGEVLMKGAALRVIRGRVLRDRRIQAVFQDPFASMNPRLIVRDILEEGLKAQQGDWTFAQREKRILEVLEVMGLDASVLGCYPHEFSGGQRQRLCIARALAIRPEIVLLDEPTSALDVTIQAQVLDLLKSLQQHFALSYLLITHDLGVVASLADRVLVMDSGVKVEEGATGEVLESPSSKAAKALLQAIPEIRR